MADVCIDCGEKMAWWRAVEESDTEGLCYNCYYRRESAADLSEETRAVQQKFEEKRERLTFAHKLIPKILVSTTNEIPKHEISKYVGMVRGGTVRSKNVGSDFFAGIKNITGGEIKGYTQLLSDAREEAIYRMKEDAVGLGANGIIGVNFSTSMIDVGAAEITAFGTGVLLEEEQEENN